MKVITTVLLFFAVIGNIYTQNLGDYRSISSGNWSQISNWEVFDGSNWVPANFYPGQNAVPVNTQIQNGHSLTLDVSPVNNLLTLTIEGLLATDNSNQTLNLSKLRVIGNFNLSRSLLTVTDTTWVFGTITDNNDNGWATFGHLYIDATGSFTTANASTFNFTAGITNYGNFSKTGTGNVTFSNKQTLNNAATTNMIINGNVTSNARLTITNQTNSITFGGIFTSNDSLLIINQAPITFVGNFTNNASLIANNTALIEFTGIFNTTANTIMGGSAFINFANNVTITGAVTFTNQNTAGITINGTLNGTVAGSTWVNDVNSTLIYAGSASAPMNTGVLNATALNNTVIYITTSNVFKSTTYHNLTLRLPASATADITRNLATALNINGNLLIESLHTSHTNTLDPRTYDITIAGNTTINTRGMFQDGLNGGINTFGGIVTIAANGSFSTVASTSVNTVIFRGGIVNNGTFSANVATFNTNTQTITPNASITFSGEVLVNSNITIAHGTATVTFSGAVTIGNNVVMTNQNQNTNGVIINGILNGSNSNSTFVNDQNAFLTYNNNNVPMAIGVLDADQTGNTVFYNSSLTTTTIKTTDYFHLTTAQNTKNFEAVSSFNIYGNLTINSGTLQVPNSGTFNFTLTLHGRLINNGTFRLYQSASLYADAIFLGSGNVISGTGANIFFRNITFNNAADKNISATNIHCYNNGTSFELQNIGGELTFNSGLLYIYGGTNINATIGNAGQGKIIFNNLQLCTGTAQTLFCNLQTNVQINNDLTFNQSSTSFLNLNGNTLTVNGNYIRTNNGFLRGNNASSFILNGSGNPSNTILFDNSANGVTNLFRTIVINRSGGNVTFGNEVFIDTFKINNGTVTTAFNVTINRWYENNATFNQSAGNFTFNKIGSFYNTGTNTFANVTLVAGDTVINNSSNTIITSNLNGLASNSTWINNDNSVLIYRGVVVPMNTGSLIATAANNTVDYNLAGAQNVKATPYFNLTFSNSGAKSLQGAIVVNGTFTVSGTASITTGTNNLTLNGPVNYTSSATFTSGVCTITYGSLSDQTLIRGTYSTLVTSGGGIKTLNSSIVNITAALNIGVGTTFEVNQGAQLRANAANVPITNNGTFRVVGVNGNPAIVTRVNAGNTFTYTQNTAGSTIMARFYQFNYLNNGLVISAGNIDHTNNFSEGVFQNCIGQQVLNITGIDLTGLPDVYNVVFNTGTTYNVTRTSGTGAINFVDASGPLAGEAYDNDNGNPGSLINWTYPSKIYYSRGNLPAGLTTSWSKTYDGSGPNPPSVTGGDLVLVIRNGDNMILDNQGNVNALQLIIGEGINGSLTIGNNSTAVTLTIQETLVINNGATLTSGSTAQNILQLYGNIVNNGTVNLKSGSNQTRLEVYGFTSQISGNTPTLADLTLMNNSRFSATSSLNINGNVLLNTGCILFDNNLSHTVLGNWNTVGTGQLNGQGTIIFNTTGITTIGGTSPVTFHNIVCNGNNGVVSLNANIQINGNLHVTNNAQFIVANYTDFIAGNLIVDAGATYLHTAGTTNFNGSTTQTINLNGNVTFNAITFSNTGVKNINGNILANGLMSILSGSTVEGSGTHTFFAGIRGDGICNFSGKVIMRGGNIYVQNGPNSFSLGTAELEINGGVGISFTAPATACTLFVSNHVSIIGGSLTINNNTLIIGQPTNTFNLASGFTMFIGGFDNFPSNFSSYALAPGSFVRYNANFDQLVRGNITYGNLQLHSTSGLPTTKTATGNIIVRNNLSFVTATTATTFDANGFDVTISGDISTANASIFDASDGGTVTFDNNGTQTFSIGTYRFNNVAFVMSGAPNGTWNKTFNIGSTLTILGNFTANNIGGTSSIIQNINLNNISLTGGNPINLLLGDFCRIQTTHPTPSTAFFDLFTGTKNLSDSSYVYYALQSANAIYGGTVQYIADNITYGNIIIDLGDKVAEGPLTIKGSFLSIGGVYNPPAFPNYPVFVDNGFTHRIQGHWYLDQFRYFAVSPPFLPLPSPNMPPSATGTLIFDGNNQNIFVNNTAFNEVRVANTGQLTIPANFNCNIHGNLTIEDGATFNPGSANIFLRGNFENSGTGRYYQTTGTTTFNGTNINQTLQTNEFSFFGNLTVNKPAASFQRLTALTDFVAQGNLTISTDAGVLDISNRNVYIRGNLTVFNNSVLSAPNDTNFITTGSTIIFDGNTTSQVIRNDNSKALTFNHIIFAGGTNKSFGFANAGSNIVDVNGNFSILGGINVYGYTAGLGTINTFYVGGDWYNTGTFVHVNGINPALAVIFDGNNQNISGSTFNTVNFSGTGVKSITGNITTSADLIISSGVTVDAEGNDFSIGRNWVNNNTGIFIHNNNTVTFTSNNSWLFSGTNNGPSSGKNFYNVVINKSTNPTPQYVDLSGDLIVENNLTINGGILRTNANNNIYLSGNFINQAPLLQTPSTSFVQAASSNIYLNNPHGGTKIIDANDATFVGLFINAPSTVYSLQSKLNLSGNDTLRIYAGTLDLNSNILTASGNPYRIIINGGTLEIDSAASLQFGGTLDSLTLINGTLRLRGSMGNEAKIAKFSGNYYIRLIGGTIEANYYEINGCGGGAGTFGVSFLNSNTVIHPTFNLSNGTFTGGTGSAYINLNGYNFSNLTVKNVKFISNTVQYNVNRPIGNVGIITFEDATGSLAGSLFENDPANQVFWTFPTGIFWTNGGGTGEWSNFRNWSSNMVPDDSTIVYLDHTYIAGAYTVNVDSADARVKRLTINNDLGPAITLQIRKGYDLYINENLDIKSLGTLLLENHLDTIHIKGSWTNGGTFTPNTGTVVFCGPVGSYSINPGGITVGKRFHNLIINAHSGARYNLNQPAYIEGNFLINKGRFDQLLPTNTLTVTGNFTVNAGNLGVFTHGNSTVIFNGNNQNINNSYSFFNVNMNGGSIIATSNIDIDNDLSILAGTTFNGQENTIYIGRNWSNFGNFIQTGMGTVVFDGSVAQAVDALAGNSTTFNHITFTNTGAKNINKPFTVAGDFIISGGITGGVNFSTHIIRGTPASSFQITGNTMVSFYGDDNFPVDFGNINLNSASTVRYISNLSTQIVRMTDNWSYGNLTLQKQTNTGTPVTKLVLPGNLVITGSLTIADIRTRLNMATNNANMTLTGSIIFPTGGEQIDWGTATSTLTHVGGIWGIDPDITGFNNLILAGSGYKQMNNHLTITGNLEIRNGIIFYMYNVAPYRINGPADTLKIGDNAFLYNSTIAPNIAFPTEFDHYVISPSSTVVLNSASGNNQILFTGKNVQYGNLTFGNNKTVTHDGVADIIIRGNWNTNTSTFVDNSTNPRNIFVGGATVRIDYYTPIPNVMLTLNGIVDQTLFNAGNNTINLSRIVFDGIGTKTLGDGNDVVNISGNLTIQPNVRVVTTRNITFSGYNWDNNGIFTQTAGTTTFNSSSLQILNPGPNNPLNYFNQIFFINGTSKRIYRNGIRVEGTSTSRLAVRSAGLTLFMGNFTHHLAVDSFTVAAGGNINTDSSSFIFHRNGNQQINIPNFTAVNVTTSTGGTKFMLSNWTLHGNLTIGSGTILSTNTASYNINIAGNWINNGTFTYNSSTVTFNGSISPITIQTNGTAGGTNDFFYVVFNPSVPVTYNLTSPITRFRRTTVIGNNANLVLNSNTLYMGSNVATDKNLTINGSLTVDAGATLRINNQTSPVTVNVFGRLNVIGASLSNTANITAEVARNGNEPIINIQSGGTIAARYYLIELLATSGLNIMENANIDATNNLSDGNWRNIPLNNARYINIQTDNIPNPTINNVSFNIVGTPGTNLYNVSRTVGTVIVTFTNVTGNIGAFQYENDAVMPPSCSTGLLRWPCIVTANWTGAINTNWHVAGNWDINQVPDNTIDVVIPTRPNNPKITDSHAYCKSLTITTGNLSLENNKNLYITGDITIGTANNIGILSNNSPADTIFVGGYWTRGNFGIFSHGNGTVVFNSSNGISMITPLTSRFHNIVIDNNATAFYLVGANVNIDGSVKIQRGTLFPATNNYNFYVAKDFYVATEAAFMPVGGSVTAGTVIFNGNDDQMITNANFDNVIFDGTQTKVTQNNISIANTATVQTGAILKAETGSSIDFNGNVTIQNGATFNDGGETHYFSGLTWTNNGNYTGNGWIIFDRNAGTQTIVSGNFSNVQLQNIATQIQSNINVTGNFIIKTGTSVLNIFTHQITNSTGTGQFIMEPNTRINVRGANNFPNNFSTYIIAPTSNVYYDGGINQTIFSTQYGNLYLMSNNTKTLGGEIIILGSIFLNDATLDVSTNNFSITLHGNWNNNTAVSGVYGSFIPRDGEVIFAGNLTQNIYANASANNNFANITINKESGSVICHYRSYTITGNLIVQNGIFNANTQTIAVGGNLEAINGSFATSGSYVLNKNSGTANIRTNNSVFNNITINSAGGATFILNDILDVRGNFVLQAGTFNANSKYVSLGDWSNDAVTIQSNYIVGAGGILALGNGTNLVVTNSGRIEIIGTETNLATITRNIINGVGSRYGFTVNGHIAARHAVFEYMNAGGIFVNTTGTIDLVNNFSDCSFNNGINTGCMLRIENNQRLSGANRINNVSFPTNPGGTAFNVRKISSVLDTIEFYNASGVFAGEAFDDDPNNLIIWTGPVILTWTGFISTDWNDSLNWSANYGPQIVPTGNEHVIIAPATNQPIITSNGARTLNLTIQNGASLQIISTDPNLIDLQVYGDLLVDGQLRLNSINDYLGVSGNFVRGTNGAITNYGNVIMNGSTGAKVINIGTTPFHNLSIEGTAIYQLGSSTVIRNDLYINNGATLSSNNFVLTVGGNWTNYGIFNAGIGRVIFNSNATTTKFIHAGNSSFYDFDISTTRTTYKFTGTTRIIRNASISSGGTLILDGKTLIYGDVNAAAENFNINGTLIIDSASTVQMGVASNILVNSGGKLYITGRPSIPATITSQTPTTSGYAITVYGGASIYAMYYNIEYINANGLVVNSGAYVDPVYNFSEGTFSYGQNGGYYLRFDCNFGGDPDSIFNVVFNAPVSGFIRNVYRTTGTDLVIMVDASGAFGTYFYEFDVGCPGNEDPNTGLIRWFNKNTYHWTGAINTDWFNAGNWSLNKVPDSSKFVIIPNVTNKPVISGNTARARKITIQTGSSLTVIDTLIIKEEILYYGNLICSGANPTICVGDNWTSIGGNFTAGNSTVILNAASGTKDIKQGTSIFNNLIIQSATSAVYKLNSNTTLAGSLNINRGTLLLNGYDMTIGGNLICNGGNFVTGTRTITFNASAGNVNINPSNSSFYNVIFNSGNGTGNATFILGSTNVSTILVTNNFTISRGTVDLSPDGGVTSNNITIGNRFSMTAGILNARGGIITIGENWSISGTGIFNHGTSQVMFVSNSGTRSIAPRGQSFYDFIINGSAIFRLSNHLDVNRNLQINNGSLDLSTSPSYNINIAGHWTNNGNFIPQTGTVIFDGNTLQSITRNLNETFYGLTINNSGEGIRLVNGNIIVNNMLSMINGDINTHTYKIIVGTGIANAGSISHTSGKVIGKLERWINTTNTNYLFPVGSVSEYHYTILRPVEGLNGGSVIVEYIVGDPGINGLPLDEGTDSVIIQFSKGYWNFIANNNFNCTNYNLSLLANYFSTGDHIINESSRILKRTNNGPWILDGIHVTATITATDSVCHRNQLNGISLLSTQFAIGATNCLGGEIAANQLICTGTTPSEFINVVYPRGGSGIYHYTWQYTTNLSATPGDGNWTDIPSSNSANYLYSNTITTPTRFVRKMQTNGCSPKYSNTLIITLYPTPNAGPFYRIPNKY